MTRLGAEPDSVGPRGLAQLCRMVLRPPQSRSLKWQRELA
jgi:hypothetical protein